MRASSTAHDSRSERGSVLIVAMIISAIIGVSLVSYINLSQSSLRFSNRSFYNATAINLAETGIEEALWSFNQVTAGAAMDDAWVDWNRSDSTTAKRTFRDMAMHANAETAVKVYVTRYDPPSGTQPKVIAQATVTIPNESRTVTKWVEVTLRRRSKFAMGLVAKNQITFRGNAATVDSWNSQYDDAGVARPSPVAYADAYKHSSGSIGSTSVAVGNVAVNNADIWGYASVGATSASAISVGTNGTIASYDQPARTVDTTRVATDFTANFENEMDPGTGTAVATVVPTLGTAGTTATYRFSGLISTSLTIQGNVTLILTAPAGSDAIRLTGGDTLTIAANSSLKIYTAADLKIGGNGIVNPNLAASSLQIYGTSTSATPQSIELSGTSGITAVVYAPNGNIKINGDVEVSGSIVGNNIEVMGDAHFHYDEALANFGGENPWGVVRWRELTTSTDRDAYTTAMAGW
jgi:hypothetical protein